MDPISIVLAVLLVLAGGAAIVLRGRLAEARRRIVELEGRLAKALPAPEVAPAKPKVEAKPAPTAAPPEEKPAAAEEKPAPAKAGTALGAAPAPAATSRPAERVAVAVAAAPPVAEVAAEPAAAPPADDRLHRHAAQLIRGAHATARNLGFDFVASPDQPTVYRVSVAIRSDWDTRALEYLERQPFECVRGVTIRGEQATVLIDADRRPPA